MTQAAPRISRGLRVLLIASLGLNLALVGLIVGVGLSSGGDKQRVRHVEVAIGPLGQALSRDDRRRIGEILRQDPAVRQNSRRALEAAMGEIVTLLRADTFDRAAMEARLMEMRARVEVVQDAAVTALIDVIDEMSAEERAAFADNLETRLERPRRDRPGADR